MPAPGFGRPARARPVRRRERVRIAALVAAVLVLAGTAAVPSAAQAPDSPAQAPDPKPSPTATCSNGAPVRHYDAVAVAVDITVNRYLDHDPEGRMFVLEEELQRVRAEEAANDRSRSSTTEPPAVSSGLQGDAIQPLTLRVRPGECLRVTLRNDLPTDEAVSFHVHGASLRLDDGGAAIATNPRATVRPGQTVRYEWMVKPGQAEGTHYFHSHGDTRLQTSHGLFGAVVVEPAGSTWHDPRSGKELRSGWDAVIKAPGQPDFREYALYYHEIGDENYQLRNRGDNPIPLVDPITGAYRPTGRALNYRSEPFSNRLALQVERAPVGQNTFDEAVAYSSYTFGDPATPLMRSYLGDPSRQRVIHGGSEVFHVHHLHGGATRWRRQPNVATPPSKQGLDKTPPVLPGSSERTDSQSLGPGETFDVINECGSGGCQASAGDFLYHCHVAEHYFAGMWGVWRVYNTTQDGAASTDSLPPLVELPEGGGKVRPAVTSDALIGTSVGAGTTAGARTLTADSLDAWVRPQLPPQGKARGYDASVFDWALEGSVYRNEPETGERWPGHAARAPDTRPPILFDPLTGRLAYPFLRPHLGKRPPFAPGHGPAPFLDPGTGGTDPPAPGANGPGGLCPAGTRVKTFDVHAVNVAVPVNAKHNIVDSGGLLYVLKEDLPAVRADPARRVPLAIRSNAAEDCVDILLTSELGDTPEAHGFSKVNLHIHFVQFDIQASDGVVAGFNYEQSIRPYRIEGEALTEPAAAGATSLRVGAGADRFQPGAVVGIGMDSGQQFEAHTVAAVNGPVVTLAEPLKTAHGAGEILSVEFVRYRWYNDTQFGTAYFHDHVNAIGTWRHGLFGALVSEPPGSTYHDPRTGGELRSGAIADIHTNSPVSTDVDGSFRELVSFVQDESTVVNVGRSTGSALNLRAEPLSEREGDPALQFSSEAHGDPATPLLDAFVGDPVVVRSLVSATNEVHTWHVDGHWFRKEPFSKTSAPVSTAHLGISERFDLVLPAAGGPQQLAGDYLYGNGRSFKLREGSWGLLRVRDRTDPEGLQPLPGHEQPVTPPTAVCPATAPVKAFDVVTAEVPLPMLGNQKGKIFALAADAAALRAGTRAPEPMVLHVGVGDCVKLRLTNDSATGAVSIRCDLLASDPKESGGIAAGRDPVQTVGPGESRTYTYFASPEVGETVATVRDGGDVVANSGLGLYGAIVVGPAGAAYLDAVTGEDVSGRSGWSVMVEPVGGPAYRDFTLLFQDEDPGIGTHRMPYSTDVSGTVGVNYRAEPLRRRFLADQDASTVYSGVARPAPATPLLTAFAGDPVRVNVLAPWSEQSQVFSLEGHSWPVEPGRDGTNMVSAVPVGGLDAHVLRIDAGAGGPDRLPGDYLWGDHREPFREAGLWGLFRVLAPGAAEATLRPLPGVGTGPASANWAGPAMAGAFFLALVAAGAVSRLRRREAV
ncbi:MAG: multicopper oxidase domain-containing protein [Acidimicrobiales bacterium]